VRVAAACAVLVAAFVGALLIGRTGGGGEGDPDTAPAIKTIELPEASTQAPKLVNTGNVPDLQKTPEASSTSGTGSSGTSQTTTSTPSTGSTGNTGSTGSTGSTGGSGGSTPTVRPPG
jgi:hypothetical protein